MSKKERVATYTQCLLTRTEDNGSVNHRQITWLPTQLSQLDKTIQLKDRDTKEWEDVIWKITERYSTKAADDVEEQERAYLYHRRGSDI